MKTIRVRAPVTAALAAALLVLAAPVLAEFAPHGPLVDNPVAYVLRRGELEASLFREKVNEGLDLFDVKQSQTAGIAPAPGLDLGTLGDLDGWRGVMGFGISNRLQARYLGKRQDIEFGRGTLHRVGNELGLRFVMLRETSRRPALALEPVFRENRGSGLSRSFSQFDLFGLRLIPPKPVTLEFGGVHDETYGARALASKHLGSRAIVSAWAEYGKTNVGSELKTDLPLTQLQDIVSALEYSSKQLVLGGGVHLFLGKRWLAYGEYQHFGFDRAIDKSLANAVDTNDVVRARLGYRTAPSTWMHLEGDYYNNNLGGEVPFLYNRLSASKFDKKYGYVGLGVTIQFSYGD